MKFDCDIPASRARREISACTLGVTRIPIVVVLFSFSFMFTPRAGLQSARTAAPPCPHTLGRAQSDARAARLARLRAEPARALRCAPDDSGSLQNSFSVF